ncbi:glycosyltransferase [Nostoc sp. NIES-2111]
MKITIVLATCNGSAHLPEQLDSLLRQTHVPDMLIACDDASTDDTLDHLRRIQKIAPFRVKIVARRDRVGPMANFLDGCSRQPNEWVAFCDQDDIWEPDKLSRCVAAAHVSGANMVIHSVSHFSVDGSGARKGRGASSVPDRVVDGLKIAPIAIFLGMSMMLNRRILAQASQLRDIWEGIFDEAVQSRPVCQLDHWSHAHDMFALMASRLAGKVAFISRPLAQHRLHDRNYSLVGSSWSQPQNVAEMWGSGTDADYRKLAAFCQDLVKALVSNAAADAMQEERLNLVRDEFSRWIDIFNKRAVLARHDGSITQRANALRCLATQGAYRSRFDGGLGVASLARDMSRVAF